MKKFLLLSCSCFLLMQSAFAQTSTMVDPLSYFSLTPNDTVKLKDSYADKEHHYRYFMGGKS